ncbi:MAG: AbrB/MazE/SpoVT family DNA-binding domain-containing protein [Defluviitaleaceae bacterium]|nr:AbrB/MazE/SpoVT family DNA-binding domain-containing protein [Defluviitaleaceae bacterium]
MESVGVRTIDELGRIVLPKEVRQALGWGEKAEIELFIHKDIVVLERKRSVQEQEAK